MADSDQSLYTLRYNQVSQQIEAQGGSPSWNPVIIQNPDPVAGINQLTGFIVAGPGSGIQATTARGGLITPLANSTATLKVMKADATTPVFTVDTTNAFVSVGAPQTDADFGVRKTSPGPGAETIMQVKEGLSTSSAGLQCFNDTNNGLHVIAIGSAHGTTELQNKAILISPAAGMRMSSLGAGQIIDFSFGGIVAANVLWAMKPTGLLGLANITTTQRNAATPAEGDFIYNVTLHKLQVYTGAAWETVTSA
jgi:hypothetical protein